MSSFLRYVWLFVANQISLRQHSFELLTFSRFHLPIWLYLFVGIWQRLVSVYLFPQNGFGFSYLQPPLHFLKKKKRKKKKYTFSNKGTFNGKRIFDWQTSSEHPNL